MEPHAASIRPSLRLITPFPSIKEVRKDTLDTRTDRAKRQDSTNIYYPILHDLPFLGLATSLLFGSPNPDAPPPSSGRDGRTKQLGDVSHMTGGKMLHVRQSEENMSDRQRKGVFAIRPQQTLASRVRRVRSRMCPDTRLLAEGVCYQHIFGTTSVIEPSLATGDCIAI